MKTLLRAALACLLGTLAAGTPAQTLNKSLIRTFNNCTFQQQYTFGWEIFTATGPEALLTLARTQIQCPEPCPALPFPFPPGSTPCMDFCSPTDPCPAPFKCSSQNGSGHCVNGVEMIVGYVAVMKASRFCAIAACAPETTPAACASASCDGSGSCANGPASDVYGLCMCPDPACPNGQRICNSTRPTIPAADLAFEAFGGPTDADWVLGNATLGTTLQLGGTGFSGALSAIAEVRFPTVPGEQYAVHVKFSTYPVISGYMTCPDAALLMSIDTRPDSCGP